MCNFGELEKKKKEVVYKFLYSRHRSSEASPNKPITTAILQFSGAQLLVFQSLFAETPAASTQCISCPEETAL